MNTPTASLISRSLVIIDHLAATVIGAAVSLPVLFFLPEIGIIGVISIILLTNIIYFTYFEGKNGQTPTKKRFGLIVTTKDGKAISYRHSLLRNSVRLVELSTVYLLGIGLATATTYSQRLGDITASTVVIEPEEEKDQYRITGNEISVKDRVIGSLIAGIGVLPLAGIILHLLYTA